MTNTTRPLEDIAEIKQMMERSSKFISLSGWSGISAGLIAILGIAAASLYYNRTPGFFYDPIDPLSYLSPAENNTFLLVDAIVVLILALASALYFSFRKAKKQGEKLWSPVSRRLILSMLSPLLTGGALCIIFLIQDMGYLLASSTLIFYGLALINAGRFSNREIIILGISEIILGILALIMPVLGIWLWGIGFGIFHIIYGITIYLKYDRIS